MTVEDGDLDPNVAAFLKSRFPDLMPTDAVIVAAYIDEDGEEKWSAHFQGNGRTASCIGLLEYAKAGLLEDMRQET